MSSHFFWKLISTLRLGFTLMLARTFGTYKHSVYDYGLSYAIYSWRGKRWAFPTAPIEEEKETEEVLLSDLAKKAGYTSDDWIRDHHINGRI